MDDHFLSYHTNGKNIRLKTYQAAFTAGAPNYVVVILNLYPKLEMSLILSRKKQQQ